MSFLTPPTLSDSVDAICAEADAAGSWWTALPKTDSKIETFDSRGVRQHNLVFTNFGMGEQDEAKDKAAWGAIKFSTGKEQIPGNKIFPMWKSYKALGFLLVRYDAFLAEIQAKLNGELSNLSYHDYEEIAEELNSYRSALTQTFYDIMKSLVGFVGKPSLNPYVALPEGWATALGRLQSVFGELITAMTGKVDDFKKHEAEAILAKELAELAAQKEAEREQREIDALNLQAAGAHLERTLEDGAWASESFDRELFMQNYAPDSRMNWSYDTVRDSVSLSDIAKWAGIPLSLFKNAALTPESRAALSDRINEAFTAFLQNVVNGDRTGWGITDTGFVYVADPVLEEDRPGGGIKTVVTAAKAGSLKFWLIAAAVVLGIFFLSGNGKRS